MAILEESGIEAEMESFYKNLFLIQDLYASGYRMADVGPDENGLVSYRTIQENSDCIPKSTSNLDSLDTRSIRYKKRSNSLASLEWAVFVWSFLIFDNPFWIVVS